MAVNKVTQALTPKTFLWGAGGQMLTPEEVASARASAASLRAPAGYTPKGWASLLGALAGEGVANYKEGKADTAETAGEKTVADALAGRDYQSAMSNPWATDRQMSTAEALQGRDWQKSDQAANWAREDARAASAWNRGADERALDAEYKRAQIEALRGKTTGFRAMTAEEKAAYGLPADSPAQIGPDGKVDTIGGGQTINVNTGDGADGALSKKLSEKEGESWATIKDAGIVAGAMSQDLGLLDELIKVAPQGPIIGPLAETFKGFNSAGDAFQSIVKRVAPSLRTPGSGATSDIEYQGFLDSLPALKNSPEGNTLINQIMKSKAAINKQRSDIVTAYQANQLTADEARKAMADLNNASIVTPEMRKALAGVGAGEPSSAPAVGTVVEGWVYNGGDPSLQSSWSKQ